MTTITDNLPAIAARIDADTGALLTAWGVAETAGRIKPHAFSWRGKSGGYGASKAIGNPDQLLAIRQEYRDRKEPVPSDADILAAHADRVLSTTEPRPGYRWAPNTRTDPEGTCDGQLVIQSNLMVHRSLAPRYVLAYDSIASAYADAAGHPANRDLAKTDPKAFAAFEREWKAKLDPFLVVGRVFEATVIPALNKPTKATTGAMDLSEALRYTAAPDAEEADEESLDA